MANIKKGNEYIVDEQKNIAKIKVKRKTGEILWYTIDLDDLERVLNFPYTWFALKYNEATDSWYAGCSEYHPELKQSRPYYLHQFIMNNRIERIDHVNRDIKDCRKENLRVITVKQNATNRTKRNKNNKSGYRNVCWDNWYKQWKVQLQVDGKNKILGLFPENKLDEAGKFAEEMRKKYYGEYAGAN